MTLQGQENKSGPGADEDPLQGQIYFFAFVDSLEMIFYQYKETCELLLYYPKIGGENIKY